MRLLKKTQTLCICVQQLKLMFVTIARIHSSTLWCWESDSMGVVVQIIIAQH